MYDLPSECNTSQKNVIFSGTLNLLEPELSFSLKTFSLDPTFAELKDTKQNQQFWNGAIGEGEKKVSHHFHNPHDHSC